MAFKLAELFVEIGAITRPLDNAIAGIKGRLSDLARMRFNIPGGGFMAALGIGAGVAGIAKAVNGASDLAETVSKVGAVFGGSSKQVTDAADGMAKAFGIPKREFLDAASQFGLIATGMGKTKTEAAEMSVRMAKLAADASSFYNVPVDVALEKIRAGLTGESEPLKAFGVIMDETTMKAYAVSHGLARKGQEMSNSAKLAARAALIEKGLATATGDLARTQDGASNQARKFWGTLTNLGDTLGTALLPTFNQLLVLLNEVAGDLSSSAQAGSGAWSDFLQMFRSAIEAAGDIYRNFGDIFERTGVMIGGYVNNIWEYIQHGGAVVAAVSKYLWESFVEAFGFVVTAAVNTKDNLVSIFNEIWEYVKSGFKDPIEFKIKPLMEGIKFVGDNQLKMPELKLTDVDNQLEAIDRRMQDRAGKRLADRDAAKAAAAANAQGPAAAGKAGGAGVGKHGVTDADAYARELQEGALKGNEIQKDLLTEAKAQTKKLGEITGALLVQAGKAAAGVARFGP